MQYHMSWLRKEHLRCDGTADHEVVIEVYKVFAQTGNAPHHGLDAVGTECRQVLLVVSEDNFMVNSFYGDTAFYMWILSVRDDEDTSYPWHELVYRAHAPVYFATVGISVGRGNILFASLIRMNIGSSLGVQYGVVAVHPGDNYIYVKRFACFVNVAVRVV